LGSTLITFSYNRLEGTARSIPVLQFLTILVFMAGARVFSRIRHANRGGQKQFAKQFPHDSPVGMPSADSVVIVGLNRLTELFLQSVQEFQKDRLHIAGLIGSKPDQTGRLMHRHRVLGEAVDLMAILKDLRVHGVNVTRVIVTQNIASLPPSAAEALRELEASSDIRVDYLAVTLGLDQSAAPSGDTGSRSADGMVQINEMLKITPAEQADLGARFYWKVKQAADVLGALVILTLLSPLIVVTAVLVAIDMGRPILFWQQRPGLGGRPFRIYKFRTMRSAFDSDGRLLSDAERVSRFGNLLRRTRLDELPQLFNILIGQMSFIGPRPLLPIDQPVGSATRLLVRPGLTGWAQVKGGRHLTATDKAALDVWYVRNASFAVDCEILLRTVQMVLFGERDNPAAVEGAWSDLAKATQGRLSPSTAAGSPLSREIAA
jgi:lipopolysaccharide/colanic/teichoic acid biosynthesis glycosyltransferase